MNVQRSCHAKATVSSDPQLLLRETMHRSSNDLQLIVAMLSLQARRAIHAEAKTALRDAAERIDILAHARAASLSSDKPSLESALRHICDALNAQAAPRGILIMLRVDQDCDGLDPAHVAPMSLAVNELATNALKHAFRDENGGHVVIAARTEGDHIIISVDDDGTSFTAQKHTNGGGLGLDLIRRLVASCGGAVRTPKPGSKLFVLTLPLQFRGSDVEGFT